MAIQFVQERVHLYSVCLSYTQWLGGPHRLPSTSTWITNVKVNGFDITEQMLQVATGQRSISFPLCSAQQPSAESSLAGFRADIFH